MSTETLRDLIMHVNTRYTCSHQLFCTHVGTSMHGVAGSRNDALVGDDALKNHDLHVIGN